MTSSSTPYWRLSSFYFFYFASLGALVPYWSLYLKNLNFSALEIGQLFAILAGTKIIAPNIWGWIADHTGKGMRIIRLLSLVAAVCFIGVFFAITFWWLVLVMVAFSFFWNASLPLFEANTLNHLGEHSHQYSQIRVWGSMGFILAVAGLGYCFEYLTIDILPWIILALFVAIWLSSLLAPEHEKQHVDHDVGSFTKVLFQWPVIALLLMCFLQQASHAPYYTFFTIYMEDNGYSKSLIGQLWALGVIAEIGLFLLFPTLLLSIGAGWLLLVTFAITVVRWLLIGFFADSLILIVAAQLLHAASYGSFHLTAIALIHRYFKGSHQGRGQALYASLSFGGGGAVGSLISGILWESYSPVFVFAMASIAALMSFIIALFSLKTFNA
ncbi:MAG: MFS transporter [Gammaproteobacteria bacterium]|nr:MFS transporter [Gammaproteobacteria bacterium]